ncbi:RICIN domain-containing protein [Streptomyces sp. NPDC058291]|uniref:RICIN domain-containing protein n=1 Tax=Streptomyces sp. NPDC058291 TaxID=3346427 RepID=UPI0036F0AAA1
MSRSRFLSLWPVLLAVLIGSVMGTVALAPPVHAATAFSSTAVNRNGGNCLDVPGSSTAEGVQLIQWACHGEANQTFAFTPVGGSADQYRIGTSTGGACVEVDGASGADNAAIVQRSCGAAARQTFRLVPVTVGGTNNVFSVQAVNSGKCVAPAGDSAAGATRLVQLPCTGTASRTWRLPAFTGSGGPSTPPTRTVRVYWLKPSDVPFDQRYPDGIAGVLREAQRYYRQELGKTFTLNDPVVEIVDGDRPRSWYENTPNGGDRYWWAVTNMQNELARKFGLNNPDSRWLNVGEISAEGEGAGGGASPGWVVLSGHDADGAAGSSGPARNRWYGGMVHELGHAFGLPDSASTDGTPMSASFYDYPDTHFSQAQKNQILNGPYGSFLS